MPRGGRRSAAPRTGRVAPLRLPCSAGCARGPHCWGYCGGLSSAPSPTGLGLPPSPAGFTCQRDAVPLTPALAEGQEPPQGRLRRTRVSLTRTRGSPPSRVKRSAPQAPLTTMTSTKAGHHTLSAPYPPLGQTQPHTFAW